MIGVGGVTPERDRPLSHLSSLLPSLINPLSQHNYFKNLFSNILFPIESGHIYTR